MGASPCCRPMPSYTAACLCGACEVSTIGRPEWVANCHDSQCRRAVSAPYATLVGFKPENVRVTKGEDNLVSYITGDMERFSCKSCSSKVYAHLHHLSHKAVYNDMYIMPNHGVDGFVHADFLPTMHIFYTSGNTNVFDGLPKYADLPEALGGSDAEVDEKYHSISKRFVRACKAACLCGACELEANGQPKWVFNCHCSQCRRALSASYATLAGFDPQNVRVIRGQSELMSYATGQVERFFCRRCSSKVYAYLHHLDHKAIYNDMFTVPNQGLNGKICAAFEPSMHVFYTSGTTDVKDGLAKYEELPAAFGGTDKKVPEVYHSNA